MQNFKNNYDWLLLVSIIITTMFPFFAIVALIAFFLYKNAHKKQVQDYIEAELKKAQSEQSSLFASIQFLNTEKDSLKADIDFLEQETFISYVSLEYLEKFNSEELKNQLLMLREREKQSLSMAISSLKGQGKNIKDNSKQILRCFQAECEHHFSGLNFKNIDAIRSRIKKSFDILNKLFATDGVSLTNDFLELKLEEAVLIYTHHLRKEQERAEQKAIREQMQEEQKAIREIEREKDKIVKEEKQFKAEVDKLMKYMQQSRDDIQTQIYADKIRELEEKLRLLEKDKENVFQREQNTRAGFVYIISNIGSFGEDVYKIGMTRRLEPMDRVKELGSASVPFEFDVHAMIFSEDAPLLENTLHHHFKDFELNKVNSRKEFFKVSLHEIAKVVRERFNATVSFTMIAEATQYRESLRISNHVN